MKQFITKLDKKTSMRTVMVRITEKHLKENVWLRGPNEKQYFWEILEFIKRNNPRAKDLEETFGSFIYDILTKQINAGMIEKDEKGHYILSTRFSQILRRFAEEWEEFVKEG